MLNKILFFAFGFLLFGINLVSAQVTNITSCGTTISSNGMYELNDTISGATTCLTVTSSHVSIDCKGNSINYGSNGLASTIGINAILGVVPRTNLTIKNCILNDINASGATNYGVSLTRFSNSYIINNTINTNGTSSAFGIYLTTSSSNNLIENNTVNSLGSTTTNYGIHLLSNSNSNTIRGNVVTSSGTTTSYALFVSTSSGYATVINNSFSTTSTAGTGNTDGHVVYFSGSNNNLIKDNSIYGRSLTRNYPAYFLNVDNTTFSNNSIVFNGTGATNYGIYGLYLSNSLVEGNSVWVNGTTTNYGIFLSSASRNTLLKNNITAIGTSTIGVNGVSSNLITMEGNVVSASGSGATNYGVQLSSSYSSLLKNNTINVTGTTPLYGVHVIFSEENTIEGNDITSYGTTANSPVALALSANNNIVANNTLKSRGTSTLNYGTYVTQNINNVIENNNITTNGTTTNYGVYLLTNVKGTQIKYNTISTFGTTTNYGIFFSNANRNHIVGNNITTNGTTSSGTTNNWGIHFALNTEENEIANNTIITSGGGLNYGLSLITNALENKYIGNKVYPGGNGASNIGAYISESHRNVFENNLFSTSGTASSYGAYFHSSSRNNNITNNNITTSGGTDSHGFHFLFITPGYPEDNNIINNYLYNISGRDFNLGTASINGTSFIDQSIGNYSFTGTGSLINVKNSSAGEIRFLSLVNGTNTTFSDRLFILNNFVKIDENTRDLNKSAEITLYNLPTTSIELQILRNGVACPSTICANLTSLQAGNVTFNVTSGGSYSINATTSSPVITLNDPINEFNFTKKNINFNFTATDDVSSLLNCSIYVENVLNQTNSTTSSGVLTNFLVSNFEEGTKSWYVSCFDGASNLGQSEVRNININYTSPNVTLNSPSNNSYLNNVNYANLNFTIYDLDLNNMTVWVYGNNTLLNTYYNQTNGTNLLYVWDNLSIRQYNWSVILNNGLKNHSSQNIFLNVINLTMNCEAGGPYQTGALVLVQGNISDGLNGLSSINVNVSVYNSGIINSSKVINSLSDGSFQTAFPDLINGNYTLNTSFSYQGHNKTCSNHFNITDGSFSATMASLVLDKIASVYNFTNETFTYNITLRLTNKGGSNSTNSNITDSNYQNSYFDIGNLAAGNTLIRSYLLNLTRNSTTYYLDSAIAQAYGINSLDNSLIFANSTPLNLTIPSSETGQQVTLVKNAYFNSENSTAVNYTLALEVINSGGVDLNSISIIDTDLDLNTNVNLNRTQNYSTSSSLIVQKAASNTEKTFVKASATINSITYQSNQIRVNVPGYGGPADTIVYAPSSVNTSTSFDSIIEIINQNPDIGQNFLVDYWITNEAENTNYTSGQQTIFVSASGSTNVTATLTSPASAGNYRFRALVTYIGGLDLAFDTFEVVVPSSSGTTTGTTSSGGSSSEGRSRITGQVTDEVICNPPYIRYGKECCLDSNNNSICDKDEKPYSLDLEIIDQKKSVDFVFGDKVNVKIYFKNLESKNLTNVRLILTNNEDILIEIIPEKYYFIGINETKYFEILLKPNKKKNYFINYKIVSDYGEKESTTNLVYVKGENNLLNNIKGLFFKLNNKIFLLIGAILLVVLTSFVTLKLAKNRNRQIDRIRHVMGLKVYSSNGNSIGEIIELYIDSKKSKIYGMLIKLNKKIYKNFGKKNLLIKYKHVESIKNIVIIDKISSDYLEKTEESDEI